MKTIEDYWNELDMYSLENKVKKDMVIIQSGNKKGECTFLRKENQNKVFLLNALVEIR